MTAQQPEAQGSCARTAKLQEFRSLPVQADEIWQVMIVNLAERFDKSPTSDDGEVFYISLWHSSSTQLVHAQPLVVAGCDRSALRDELLDSLIAFQRIHRLRFRPEQIHCSDEHMTDALSEALGDDDLRVVYQPHMPYWDEVLTVLPREADSNVANDLTLPALAESGYSKKLLQAYAQAAASFYQAGLWDYLEDVDLIAFESPAPPVNMRYTAVLGYVGQAYGLSFYSSAEEHYRFTSGQIVPGSVSLTGIKYEPLEEVPSEDVRFWQELSLPLGSPNAFPEFLEIWATRPRRPTAKELEYATIILQMLAETTESDLDAGRWSKTIVVNGRKTQCTCSIPNLIHPPDQKEWIRRGLKPAQRAQDALFLQIQDFIDQQPAGASIEQLNALLNSEFADSLSHAEFSLDTPAGRAAAKYQEAVESFGRRRVLLDREAIAEDPDNVDSLVLLAELTRMPERRIEAFQQAVDAARQQLGSSLEHDAGLFWGLVRTRPFMRAAHGLAMTLEAADQTGPAIELYLELLRLNPEDNLQVHYNVIPLLMIQNRDEEAQGLLEKYSEPSGLWHYMQALAEYRRHGPAAARTQQAVHAAFKANSYVVERLQSEALPLDTCPEYTIDSWGEASDILKRLRDAWDQTAGFEDFLMDRHSAWEENSRKARRDWQRKARRKKSSLKKRKRR